MPVSQNYHQFLKLEFQFLKHIIHTSKNSKQCIKYYNHIIIIDISDGFKSSLLKHHFI